MDGQKSFPGKQTADQGQLSPIRMDGRMIAIIGFKLLNKGRDIRSTSNMEQNTIPDGEMVANSLAYQTLSKGVEG